MSPQATPGGERRRQTLVAIVIAALSMLTVAIAEQARPGHPEDPVVERFLASRGTPLMRYRAIRRLEAANDRTHQSGWLLARTTVDPDRGFAYEILGEGGSKAVRERVLRATLEREAAAYQTQESSRVGLTPENYLFGTSRGEPDGLLRLSIVPRRKDELLVDGGIVLTADGDLVRLEGRLARNPSFWTRRVDVVRRYTRIGGVRVPVSVTSVAQVLLIGPSSFSMCYDYESVNGDAVDSRTSCP